MTVDDPKPSDIPFGTRFRWNGGDDHRPFDRLPKIHCGPFGDGVGSPYVSGDRWWMYSTPGVFTTVPVYANEGDIDLVPRPEASHAVAASPEG